MLRSYLEYKFYNLQSKYPDERMKWIGSTPTTPVNRKSTYSVEKKNKNKNKTQTLSNLTFYRYYICHAASIYSQSLVLIKQENQF